MMRERRYFWAWGIEDVGCAGRVLWFALWAFGALSVLASIAQAIAALWP